MKIKQLKTYEISKNNSKREVYSSTILPQEIRKTSDRQFLTLHLKQLKKEQKNSKINIRKEVIKIRAEMKEKKKKRNERRNSKD